MWWTGGLNVSLCTRRRNSDLREEKFFEDTLPCSHVLNMDDGEHIQTIEAANKIIIIKETVVRFPLGELVVLSYHAASGGKHKIYLHSPHDLVCEDDQQSSTVQGFSQLVRQLDEALE